MKSNNLNIDFNSNSKASENVKGISVPQSTKYSGHSKIKGFSFQLESGINKNDALSSLDQATIIRAREGKEKEEKTNSNCKIEEENSLHKGHKPKISLQSPPLIALNIGRNDSDKDKKENSSISSENKIGVNGNISIDTPLNITDLIKDQNYVPLSKNILNLNFDKYESTRYSTKSLNLIKSFAANTHQGVVRKYNEDRVSIILNIVKPSTFKGGHWPVCSFFGVFDGHGGNKCADYLKDNLHNFVSFIYDHLLCIDRSSKVIIFRKMRTRLL
jgi:hypothetical protein